jgi:hypothetical protein
MTTQEEFALDTIEGIAKFYFQYRQSSTKMPQFGEKKEINSLYCPHCGDKRRVRYSYVSGASYDNGALQNAPTYVEVIDLINQAVKHNPWLLKYTCVQCQTMFTVLVYQGYDDKPHIIILPKAPGGVSTPHAPRGVSFYLDQAYKAQSIGANSAAVAMYRGALEHLLFEQGYQTGMLGAKLKSLENDIRAGTAKQWALDLDTEYLTIIQSLGNGAIHPNDGDVTRQSVLDNELLSLLGETFQMLLWLIYEVPHAKAANLTKLKTKLKILNK